MNYTTVKFLINIKNASLGTNETLIINYDSFSLTILKTLYTSGLIQGYTVLDSSKVVIYLRKVFNKTLTRELKLISTPKTKVSLDYKAITRLKKNTNSLMFFSTDQGLFTINECKKNKIGGVLLFIC
jgi:ribosomal protein S8